MMRGTSGLLRRARLSLVAGTLASAGLFWPSHALAASFAAKDLQVLGRAVAFLSPPLPAESVLAIAYVASNPASRQDAEAIAALIGPELRAGAAILRPKLVEAGNLEAGGFRVMIAAAGANSAQLGAAARKAGALCITTDVEAVRAGFCAMAITSEPRVEIVVNHAVSSAAGIAFVAAFRMMIREL